MTWRNRQGQEIEQRMDDLEKSFGLENLKDIPIETEFPAAGPEGTSIHLVENGGNFFIVILTKGVRYQIQLPAF